MNRAAVFPRTSLPARRHWAAWLVVALLWAQGLGVWHHTVHAPGLKALAAASSASASPASTLAVASASTASDYRSLLNHSANSADCRLLDQLLLADGLAAPGQALAALPATPALVTCAPLAQVALAALRPYLARAPPALG